MRNVCLEVMVEGTYSRLMSPNQNHNIRILPVIEYGCESLVSHIMGRTEAEENIWTNRGGDNRRWEKIA